MCEETKNTIATQYMPSSNVQSSNKLFAAGEASIYDIFGRLINSYGIDLVDWPGYMANPYIKLTVKPPATGRFPITITLKAQGSSRLMMDLPSTLSSTGATKTLTFANSGEQKTFKLAIAPDRAGGFNEIEHYNLNLSIRENNGAVTTQNVPIRVLDMDDNGEPSIPLVFDYRYDTVNNYFSDPAIRKAAEQAIKDWFYYFDIQPFDSVPVGAERNWIPNDNFSGHTIGTNNASYTGEWIFLRGINGPYSTGWNANNGSYHKRGGVQVAGPIHRSLGVALDFYDNAQVFTSIEDDDWYKTDLNQVTDVYGLIMHEFGHGFAFSDSWQGMRNYHSSGGNDAKVTAYQGVQVPLDSSYHIPGDRQYWDRLSGHSAGWSQDFPLRRWMLTKLTLLVAERAGWKLRKDLAPFMATEIVTTSLPKAVRGQYYETKLTAKGGVPFYDWRVISGSLPAGLQLDRFTGVISGTVPSSQATGNYSFTVELRDYDELGTPFTRNFTISI